MRVYTSNPPPKHHPAKLGQERRAVTRSRRGADLAIRLAGLTDRSGGDGACWLWQGNKSKDGYGRIYVGRRSVQAHRLALELALGRTLAADEVTRHGDACVSRACVNPAHLQAGSIADNNHDTRRMGNHMRKLLPHHLVEIRAALKAPGKKWGRLSRLAREYGVTHTTIARVGDGGAA